MIGFADVEYLYVWLEFRTWYSFISTDVYYNYIMERRTNMKLKDVVEYQPLLLMRSTES